MMLSTAKRPMVNTDVLRGKASGKIVASLSNGFSLGITSSGSMVIVSCVNFGAGRMSTSSGGLRGVILSRSARILSRIIMVKCKTRGGRALANSITMINDSVFGSGNAMSGPLRTVRKRIPKLHVAHSSTTPNRRK